MKSSLSPSLVLALGLLLLGTACGDDPATEPVPPASCEAVVDGGMESRVRYRATSVPHGETCAVETQARVCGDGTWSAWSGTFTATGCVVAEAAGCDGMADGTLESRVRYQTATVAYRDTCDAETQTRSCDNGAWSAWTGSFAAEACTVDGAATCDGAASGAIDSRVRYQSESAPAGGACIPETQTRTCVDGTWSTWSGSLAFDRCTVADARSCDGTPHGGQDSRTRYRAATVPFGAACAAEVQTRSCDDGAWSLWSGTFTASTCAVADAASCDGTAHGQTVSRVHYQASSVAFGETCAAEVQTRTCDNGTWSTWSGTFTAATCTVADPLSCDGTAHGQAETRVRYEAASVPFGTTCSAQAQSRTCDDGTWLRWSGGFTAETCTVAEPLTCDGTAHGETVTQIRYQSSSVPFGGTCRPETQSRTCSNGSWSPWSGHFTAPTCTVAEPRSCDGVGDGEAGTRVRYQAASVPFGSTCVPETQSRSCSDGTWSTWSGTFTAATCTVAALEPGFESPSAVAYGGAGQLFVVDHGSEATLRKVDLGTGTLSTVAGVAGYLGGIASDRAGTLFVVTGASIRTLVIATGELTTVAGVTSEPGTRDGTGTDARFQYITAITYDDGQLFVVDDQRIRQVSVETGAVTTLAGAAGVEGQTNGTGSAARFRTPRGIASDGAGTLYVADTSNHMIRKVVVATGAVTTLAGTRNSGMDDSTDGTGRTAGFNVPESIAFDGHGTLFVTDEGLVRTVDAETGATDTVHGIRRIGNRDSADCPGQSAMVSHSTTLALDGDGHILLADTYNRSIRRFDIATGELTTVAGVRGTSGCTDSTDGTGRTARFEQPHGVAIGGAGGLLVADSVSAAIRRVATGTGAVTTLAGIGGIGGSDDSTDGTGRTARFWGPRAIASDGAGTAFIADSSVIRRMVVATGAVTTLAGDGEGSRDGTGTAAQFNSPTGLVTDGAGNLFVADTYNNTIRKVVIATGEVTTLAGLARTAGSADSTDGTGRTARFTRPRGIAHDGAGHLFVADSENHTIRKVVIATGVVTTVAGAASTSGSDDGPGASARFRGPGGVVADGAGRLFVADSQNGTIREIVLATGAVTTLAGTADARGSHDGTGASAAFGFPVGIAIDGAGHLFVADAGNNAIRTIVVATRAVSTLAGTASVILR